MASGSIFTFEADPQRVSSPWAGAEDSARRKSTPVQTISDTSKPLEPAKLADYGVTKLEAEPQEGPTEYKLHLLLRARRKYKSMSTMPAVHRTQIEPRSLSSSNQSRQVRLQQLTNQLLWRLQQSSPCHVLKPKDLVIPQLPDDTVDLSQALTPQPPLPGLEESRGALYEIGVSDDGTLVGLTKDEMDESITTLRVMAATLGCRVEILRYVIVGECEWLETSELVDIAASQPAQILRHDSLWVAEAFVVPDFGSRHRESAVVAHGDNASSEVRSLEPPSQARSTTDQLRVTLTGPTTSGKSTLLGTLSTGTLDNGRGRSRLSLFKHRHEVASGMTSSVAQELIGYLDDTVINYAQSHIESWLDIHYESENGRLVFVSDSAGHPRFRRTILRGLFGWAPQWTVLCLAADDAEANSAKDGLSSSAQDVLGTAGAGVDLAKAHLELCLRLQTPLVVVITKLDLATKTSLQRVLGKVLTLIKGAGRIPKILQPGQNGHQDVTNIPEVDMAKAQGVVKEMKEYGDLLKFVPIVLTSSVDGSGVGLTHALLANLPLPATPTPRDYVGMALNPEQPASAFHIDDTFSRPADFGTVADNSSRSDLAIVVSGYLRFGQLSVGDAIVVGPFPSGGDDPKGTTPDERPSPGGYGLSISHPSSAELAKIAIRNAVAASAIKGEWHNAKIVSIRNLRLAVRTLEAGQVGTIGILLDLPPPKDSADNSEPRPRDVPRIRKGMVLAVPSSHMLNTGLSLQAASGLTAHFRDPDASSLLVGSLVNVYCGTVRAAARVLGLSSVLVGPDRKQKPGDVEDAEEIFAVDQEEGDGVDVRGTEVVLELLSSREWVELGSPIILLEGGRNDRSGLEGFVGSVVEIVD
ncbi:GTP-binding protein [Sodiomyces alkalinus F11]|uniref:GTP-binding protein n=1 Tax=Sodiomyces alkalinus (strain CBS 110278 / VKM F-3762 / F11) TaxID=1314773 RepID=A0A3N2PS34_SODAK|nr:GTP-binding protein [Sodiomyces alkalinus F11]ROT37323.1 GTP-binding protein [Sodiomyces alkalinus F11]